MAEGEDTIPLVRLGELCSKIGSGATPRGGSAVYQHAGTAFIRSQNVHDNRFDETGLVRINDDAADQLRGVEVRPGDVLLNITGDSVLRCCLVPESVLPARVSQHVAILRSNGSIVPRFLQGYLVSPTVRAELLTIASGGATRKALTKAQIGAIEIPLPGLSLQSAIAEVLGALDDKIAANTRLAATADALACASFARAVEGVGLSDETFADVAHVGGGATPRSSVPEYWDDGVRWLTPTDVTALPGPYVWETKRTISPEGLAAISSPLYPRGTIFMTSRATIGAFAIAEEPMAANQGFIALQPRDGVSRYWLFHEMRSRVPEFLDHANGATFLELSRGNFKKLRVRRLSIEAERRFEAEARVLHERASAALRESSVLSATRDTLLPQLMSGTLRVREAAEMAGL